MRLFIAIELPAEVRAALASAQAALGARLRGIRWVDPAGAHLTLKFLGETSEERLESIVAALEQAASRSRSCTLRTAELGLFPGPKAPRVVWLGVRGEVDQLRSLHLEVERFVAPLGYPTERRGFSPHLTLGRTAKDATGAERVAIGVAVMESAAPTSVAWGVSAVSLMRSTLGRGGAHYDRLAAVQLDAPGAPVIIPSADESDSPASS